MNSLTQAFQSLSNSVSHTLSDAAGSFIEAMQTPKPAITYTRADIISLEEAERARRVRQAATSDVARKNASHSAQLISNASFPVRLAKNGGIIRMSRLAEERERSRLLSAKPEMVSRKVNANLIAGKLMSLGWPFIHNKSGPHYLLASESSLAEEEERVTRMANPFAIQLAQDNARQVSNLIRWGYTGLPHGSKRFSRMLEEKERSRRLADQEEHVRSAEGAYQQAGIIRTLGWPFFRQGEHHDDTLTLELQEQARRLSDKGEQIRARQHANVVSRLLPIWAQGKSNAIADQEKARRLSDVDEQQRSMEHAHQISALIAGSHTDKDVEHERLRRMKPYHSAYEQELSKYIANMVAQFSKKDANSLYEKEARRRLRDINNERITRQNANKVAALISASEAFQGWDHRVEEAERKERMYDRSQQRQAMKNARKLSNLIKERAATLPEVSLPRSAPSDYMPPAQTLQTALPFQGELLEKRPMAPPATALPFTNELLQRAPSSSGLQSFDKSRALPFESELLEKRHMAPPATALPFTNELLERSSHSAPQSFDKSRALPFESELLEKRHMAPPATALPFTNELLHRAPMSSESTSSSMPQSLEKPRALPFGNELLEKRHMAPPATALPFTEELLHRAPMSSAPVSRSAPESFEKPRALPFGNELLERRPMAPPATALPFTEELLHRAPMSSAPVAMPTAFDQSSALPFEGSMAPSSTAQPMNQLPQQVPTFQSFAQPALSAPMTSNLPMAPLYSAPLESSYTGAPIYSALTVTAPVMPATSGTYYSAAGSHELTEKQRLRLEKQALRHNKRAARENKKAEKDIRKAEKLHTKGKESRAVRHENRAEQHVIASKQHALWANDLLTKNATYAPLTSVAPLAGRSAM